MLGSDGLPGELPAHPGNITATTNARNDHKGRFSNNELGGEWNTAYIVGSNKWPLGGMILLQIVKQTAL
jgi:hypothetical protein